MSRANGRTAISADDAEEFTASLGQFVSGSYRQIALAQRMGIPDALGLTTEQWVRDRLGGYVHMAIPERREVVKELADEGLSQREIAAVVGVGVATVNRDLDVPNGTEEEETPQYDAGFSTPSVPIETPEDMTGAPPLLSIVDLETGEVVADSEPMDVADAAYQVSDDAGKARIDRANFLHALSKSIQRISRIPAEWDAEAVAHVIDPELKKSIDINVANLARWAQRIDEAQPKGLHVVSRERA